MNNCGDVIATSQLPPESCWGLLTPSFLGFTAFQVALLWWLEETWHEFPMTVGGARGCSLECSEAQWLCHIPGCVLAAPLMIHAPSGSPDSWRKLDTSFLWLSEKPGDLPGTQWSCWVSRCSWWCLGMQVGGVGITSPPPQTKHPGYFPPQVCHCAFHLCLTEASGREVYRYLRETAQGKESTPICSGLHPRQPPPCF